MGAAVLSGAIVASISNIAFGWLSDFWGTRRAWVAAGLGLTVASYVPLYLASSPLSIVAAVCLFQCMLNMLLSPLAAWMAESISDDRKGRLGGGLGAGPLVGAAIGVVATLPVLTRPWMPLALVCLVIIALTTPLLISGRTPAAGRDRVKHPAPNAARAGLDLAFLWLSRLMVQVAGGTMFAFLLLYFHALPSPPMDPQVAELSALALLIAFPVALSFGVRSDRLGRRKPFLVVAAVVASAGLLIMAGASDFASSALGYLLFASASTVFLALHSGYAMQLLPSPDRCGRDLGVVNLTNTLPSIIAPVLALWLVPQHGFSLLLTLLALLLLLAAAVVLFVRRDDAGLDEAHSRARSDQSDMAAPVTLARVSLPLIGPVRPSPRKTII